MSDGKILHQRIKVTNSSFIANAIKDKLQPKKDLSKCLTIKLCSLINFTKWLKVQLIKYSINRHTENLMNKIKKRHSKKLDALIFEKKMRWFIQQP